ncbi:MAG: TM2 domain-containing protein [Chitinophagales bacterium]|nr:TM2 domain-containing protein [Chitinophagales bacterium]
MDKMENPFLQIKSITPAEMMYLKNKTALLNEEQLKSFTILYNSKRRESDLLLIIACAGFFGVAGIQRFLVGQILMGLLFFFTAGFCGIGTIIDIINNKELANEYNAKMADECLQLI